MKLRAHNPRKVANAKCLVRNFAHAGAEIVSCLAMSTAERYDLIREMMAFVKENNIVEIKDLLDYAMEERFEDWFPLLCDNSAYIMDS